MKVLAIYPEARELQAFETMPPLGLAWVAAAIKPHVKEICIIDQQVDRTSVTDTVSQMKPDFVFLGGTSHSRQEVFDLSTQVKNHHAPSLVVYGGPHASFTAHETLSSNPAIDIVVHGEGEYTAIDLVNWKKAGGSHQHLKNIPGISYRENSIVQSTGWRPFNRNLDNLPYPARELLPMEKYMTVLDYLRIPATSIITARGCPIACSFCSASKLFSKHYATRSAVNVVDEIEFLIKTYHIQGLKIFDSTFTLQKKHVIDFCNELERRGINIPWECEIRVGSVDKALLARMKQAGCYFVNVGIESGDQHVLDRMHKKINLSDTETLLQWTKELDIYVKAFFSIGHIDETLQSGKKTIKYIQKHESLIKLIILNPGIRIYPGTELENYAKEKNLLPDGFSWSIPYENLLNKRLFLPVNSVPILIQPTMTLEDIRKLRIRYLIIRALSIRHLYFRIKFHLNYRQLHKYLFSLIYSAVYKNKER